MGKKQSLEQRVNRFERGHGSLTLELTRSLVVVARDAVDLAYVGPGFGYLIRLGPQGAIQPVFAGGRDVGQDIHAALDEAQRRDAQEIVAFHEDNRMESGALMRIINTGYNLATLGKRRRASREDREYVASRLLAWRLIEEGSVGVDQPIYERMRQEAHRQVERLEQHLAVTDRTYASYGLGHHDLKPVLDRAVRAAFPPKD